MYFDLTSFIIGAGTAGIVARFFIWSENSSLANRIAYSVIVDAQKTVKQKYLQTQKNIWKEHAQTSKLADTNSTTLKAPDLTIFGELEISEEKIYPIEDEDFQIRKVPDLRIQTDIHIEEYYAVFSKKYGLWFLIEDKYNCEIMGNRYNFYLSDQHFKKKKLIQTPYDFDLSAYL